MKRITLIFSLVFFVLSVFSQTQIKVMSFNLHSAHDATIAQIAEFIKEQEPDLVAVQEVDYYTNRKSRPHENNKDMLTELAYLTGMQGMYFPVINVHGGKYGNAILSKFGMEKTDNILLPYVAGTEQRAASVCKLTLNDETPLIFVSTHIDAADSENCMNQFKKLNELFNDAGLVVLGGDLNKRSNTTEIAEFNKVFETALNDYFDYIAFTPKSSWKVINKKIFFNTNLSDHNPIMVTLELNK